MRQLNRCRHGIIKIPDRDDAGLRALKHWNTNRSVTLKVALQYKDIDEMCSDQESNIDTGGNIEWVKEYLDECIGWILTDTHNGKQSIQEEITIL